MAATIIGRFVAICAEAALNPAFDRAGRCAAYKAPNTKQRTSRIAMNRTLRACTLAIVASLVSFAAMAVPLTAPDGSFTVEITPGKKWKMEKAPLTTQPDTQLWVAGDGEQYCYFNAKQRPDTVKSNPGDVVKSMQAQLANDKWEATATPFFDAVFAKGKPVAAAASVETVAGWPVQFVTLSGYKYGPVVAALHMRPGFEVQAYCAWEDGKDHSAEFKAIALSVTTAKDAAWQGEIAAAAAAPPPLPPAPPPPPPVKKK
jgi:hypothetical protein